MREALSLPRFATRKKSGRGAFYRDPGEPNGDRDRYHHRGDEKPRENALS
jgi:hypothetical protein